MFGSELSPAQRRLLIDIVEWGEIGPSAEDVTGLRGAAFWAVADSLRSGGYINDAYEPTQNARDAWAAHQMLK